ncbi:unnamed protein product [Zymoseptoria tritici ST99CH_3D7]|uniref:Peptidase M20 dimerisation domain-containing protein n=1 Tax=Zymoseptoria tritici (strain ST99CH_3D7) TaxID=1276538 RepID=A0A1X7SA20_ZYMT9|nr:unnamed protein product [Zymoseptoria tritici ST99CH_3D7]
MSSFSQTLQSHRPDLQPYEELYKHFHANPELSNQEKETAATIASYLTTNISSEFDVRQNIGGFGIAALFRNGEGPTVLLRADFDALPILERTGLPYASKKTQHDPVTDTMKPVMHACGHDMHITCLLAAAHTLVNAKDSWSGTLLLAFQPAEERGTGAQAMVDDGLCGRAVKPPTIEITRNFPRTVNDEAVTGKLEESFSAHFVSGPQAYNNACDKLCGSEDFGILASAVEKPASFFMYGGIPHELWDQCEKEGTLSENVPINHSALFAPAIHPTLTTGIDAYVLSALTWMGKR